MSQVIDILSIYKYHKVCNFDRKLRNKKIKRPVRYRKINGQTNGTNRKCKHINSIY